jgi:hypothetical protein
MPASELKRRKKLEEENNKKALKPNQKKQIAEEVAKENRCGISKACPVL